MWILLVCRRLLLSSMKHGINHSAASTRAATTPTAATRMMWQQGWWRHGEWLGLGRDGVNGRGRSSSLRLELVFTCRDRSFVSHTLELMQQYWRYASGLGGWFGWYHQRRQQRQQRQQQYSEVRKYQQQNPLRPVPKNSCVASVVDVMNQRINGIVQTKIISEGFLVFVSTND